MHILWIVMFLVLYMLLTCKPLRPASFMYTLWIVMSSPASFMHILWVVVFVVLYMFFYPEAISAQSVYAYPLGSDVHCSIHVFDQKAVRAPHALCISSG